MNEHRTSAHPMLEPADYELTPEKAANVLRGDLLAIYALLWNSSLASAIDGPATQEQSLELKLFPDNPRASAPLMLQSVQQDVVESGWTTLLPSERQTPISQGGHGIFPEAITLDLQKCGTPSFNATGQLERNADLCRPLASHLGPISTWRASIETLSAPPLSLDKIIEQMAEHGVGRPATYADRLTAALDRDLVCSDDGGLRIGEYGKEILDTLDKQAACARINADFCAELERELGQVEQGHVAAGDVLRVFCERVLGCSPTIADWLDGLDIAGETFAEALARAEAMLPPADSWSNLILPPGLSPQQLAKDAQQAMYLRGQIDEVLANMDRPRWKKGSARQRAIWRLAGLGAGATPFDTTISAANASRDIVLRWWVDLGPEEPVISPHELDHAFRDLGMLDQEAQSQLSALSQSTWETL